MWQHIQNLRLLWGISPGIWDCSKALAQEFEIVPRHSPRKQSFKFCKFSNISDYTQTAQRCQNTLFEPALLDLARFASLEDALFCTVRYWIRLASVLVQCKIKNVYDDPHGCRWIHLGMNAGLASACATCSFLGFILTTKPNWVTKRWGGIHWFQWVALNFRFPNFVKKYFGCCRTDFSV